MSPLVLLASAYILTTMISMATMNVGFAVFAFGSLAVVGMSRFWKDTLKWSSQVPLLSYLKASLLLASAIAASLIYAKLRPVSYLEYTVQVDLFRDLRKLWYFLIPVVTFVVLKQMKASDHRKVLTAWVWFFGAVSLFGVFQHFLGWSRTHFIPQGSVYHVMGFFGHQLTYTSVMVFPFFVVLENAFAKKPLVTISRKMLLSILVIGAFALYATYSRMSWISIPLGIFFWATLKFPLKRALQIGGIGLVFLLALSQVPQIQYRISNVMGTTPRFRLWKANFDFFLERPVFGVGFQKNGELSKHYLRQYKPSGWIFIGHAHNNLVDVLGNTGLYGVIAWVFWVALTITLAYRMFRTRADEAQFRMGRAFLAAWFAFHLNGLTQLNFWDGKVTHQIMWVVAWSLLYQAQRSNTRKQASKA